MAFVKTPFSQICSEAQPLPLEGSPSLHCSKGRELLLEVLQDVAATLSGRAGDGLLARSMTVLGLCKRCQMNFLSVSRTVL